MLIRAVILVLAMLALHIQPARADWQSAGPIWNDMDAQRKCPNTCGRDGWDGNWKTVEMGRNSVCFCKGKGKVGRNWSERAPRRQSVDAGVIWNDGDAKWKCPRVCGNGKWDGNWRHSGAARSVCDCIGR
jgi:rubredoxin